MSALIMPRLIIVATLKCLCASHQGSTHFVLRCRRITISFKERLLKNHFTPKVMIQLNVFQVCLWKRDQEEKVSFWAAGPSSASAHIGYVAAHYRPACQHHTPEKVGKSTRTPAAGRAPQNLSLLQTDDHQVRRQVLLKIWQKSGNNESNNQIKVKVSSCEEQTPQRDVSLK